MDAGLWVVVSWVGEERVIGPLICWDAAGTCVVLDHGDYTSELRAELAAVVADYIIRPTPWLYRVTAAHVEQYPAIRAAAIRGQWVCQGAV